MAEVDIYIHKIHSLNVLANLDLSEGRCEKLQWPKWMTSLRLVHRVQNRDCG